MEVTLDWDDFKNTISSRNIHPQWHLTGDSYFLYAFDSKLVFECKLDIDEALDFETNHKDNWNLSLEDRDITGRNVIRVAASNKGTSYVGHFFDFTTCKLNSLVCKDWEGNADMSLDTKYYKSDGTELTTQGDIDLYGVKTVVTFKPMYDYELVSGTVNISASPTDNMRLWVVGGAPELGAAGVKEFIRNLNLKFVSPSETLQTDGRASKFMKKTTMGVPYNTNQLQIILLCDTPGTQHDIMMSFEYFRV